MASTAYAFIDIAVLNPVRGRFAAGEALLLLEEDAEAVLWANAPGAALVGADDLIAAVGMSSGLTPTARRQIVSAPARGHATQIVTRIGGRPVSLSVQHVDLPRGGRGILLAAPDQSASDNALERAIAGFGDSGQYLAIVDHEATILAATDGLADMGLTPAALGQLVADVRLERDRLVKRRLQVEGRRLPVGFARLTDDPALHLLVVVDDGEASPAIQDAAAPAVETPVEQAGPDVGPDMEEAPDATPMSPGKTLRFLWRTDEQGRLNAISDEFLDATGIGADALIGRTFPQLSETLGIDRDGVIAALLDRRDTWSGRTVHWPVGAKSVPVDLAALPAYSRERAFEGFRGFGVARFGDATTLHLMAPLSAKPDGQAEVEAETAAPDETVDAEAVAPPIREDERPDTPAPEAAEEPAIGKVIHLADRRERSLSQAERSAFREIGDRLRSEEPEPPAPFGRRATDIAPGDRDEPTETTQPAATAPEEALAADTGEEPEDAAIPADESQPEDYPPLEYHDPTAEAEAMEFLRQVQALEDEGDEAAADDWDPEQAAAAFETEYVDEPTAFDDGDEDDDAIEAPAADAQSAPLESAPLEFAPLEEAHADPVQPAQAGRLSADTGIVDRMPVPVLIHAGDELHYANPEFLSLTGYGSLDALRDAGGLDALFPDSLENERDGEERALRLKRKDGVEFPIEALLRSVKWLDGHALMLVVRVVEDEQGELETAALAEARARIAELRTILDTATDGVVIIDQDGSIRSISRPAEALFGFDSDDLTGKPFTSLFAIESQPTAREYLTGLADHGVASLLNDGREVIGREAQGRFIPLFMTIGRMPNNSGYCAVLRDVTQWKRAEEELSQSRRLAERASSQKTDFLARVSHEIRTPLNAIIGFSELMLDEKFGPVANDRYRDYLRDINRSGSHVLDLVNDLLDITKIEAGEQEMSYEAVSLNDTLAEAVAIMQPQANRERVIIRSSFATRLPQVVADLRSVRQIALNILSNAVRYTQAGGQVIISTAQEPNGDIVMRVRDTGVGMSQTEIEQALKPFKQINSLNRTRGDGTGLGLPLTKAMVEANRGRFVITSAPNEGTLVEVVFPSTRVLAQ